MAPEEIATVLKKEFGDDITDVHMEGAHPHVSVAPQAWSRVARFLRDDSRMKFNWLRCISGIDHLEDNQLSAVYDLHSAAPPGTPGGTWQLRSEFAVRVRVDRDNPRMPSVADVWPAADWHEREAYDLLGIVFENHPDSVEDADGVHPRRILCPDDWEGHALRKDYEFPMEYHGIPCVTEYGQVRQVH